MSKVAIAGNASGTGVFTIASPNSNTDRTLTLPDSAGTLLNENSSLPAANLTGTVPAGAISGKTLRSVQTASGSSAVSLTVNHNNHDSGHDLLTKTFTPPSSQNILIVSYSIPFYKGSHIPGFDPMLYINGSETAGMDGSSHFTHWYDRHRVGINSGNMHANLSGLKAVEYNSSSSCTVTIKVRIYDENTNSGVVFSGGSAGLRLLTIQVFA